MVGGGWLASARGAVRGVAKRLEGVRVFFWPKRIARGAGPDVVVIAKDGSIETTDAATHARPLRRALWRLGVWSRQVGLKALVLRVAIIEACVIFSTLVAMALGYLAMDVGLEANRSEGVKTAYMIYLFVFAFIPPVLFSEKSKTRPLLSLFLFTLTWLVFLAASAVGSGLFLSEYESVTVVGFVFFLMWFVIALLSLTVSSRR
jgi:hypothetical protein